MFVVEEQSARCLFSEICSVAFGFVQHTLAVPSEKNNCLQLLGRCDLWGEVLKECVVAK